MILTNKISPSMMCVDFMNIKNTINIFEKNGIEYLHIDIMDGHFVPNLTLGTDFCRILKENTNIPLDIHLMASNPENMLDWLPIGENDYVSVHLESTNHLQRAVDKIKKTGAKAMAAINPATPFTNLEYVLSDIDAVLAMTVNPGFAGQKLIPQTLKKIENLRSYLDENGYSHIEIEADGNVSFENAKLMKKAGANIFVAGTSSVFSKSDSLENNIKKLRESTETL